MSCKHKYTYIGAGEWECDSCREVVDNDDYISWFLENQSNRIAKLEHLLKYRDGGSHDADCKTHYDTGRCTCGHDAVVNYFEEVTR